MEEKKKKIRKRKPISDSDEEIKLLDSPKETPKEE